jgi:peptidoglycan/LPS O-acetylase OafA/YrhL
MANLANLDGIRAIAVTLVVLSHLLLLLGLGNESVYSIKAMGRIGVAIFFVHTTLVLMASLDRHRSSVASFYVRRVFRIYPLSIAMVLLLALLYTVGNAPVDARRVLANLLLVQNITDDASIPAPLWTLPYEVQMYLALPALFLLTKSRHAIAWLTLLLVSSAAVVLALGPDSMVWKVFRFVPSFLPGVLAFVLSQKVRAKMHPMVLFGLILLFGVAAIPILVAAGVSELPLMWVLCATIGLTVPLCRQVSEGRFAITSKLIAKYSYGIYLTHVIALAVVDTSPNVYQWLGMLMLLPGLAYVSYHGIEKHGIAIGSRIADRLDANVERKMAVTSLRSHGSGSG